MIKSTIDVSSVKPPKNNYEKKAFHPIAGFWRRVFAFFIDMAILAVPAEIIGLIFLRYFNKMGSESQLLGLIFLLPYFGIMNSKICDGQTLGKKVFNIAVRDQNDQPISLAKSLLRTTFLFIKIIVTGICGFLLSAHTLILVLVSIVWAIYFGTIFLVIINKNSRQGMHDLIFKTYVVDLRKKRAEGFPESKKANWIIATILMTFLIGGYIGYSLYNANKTQNVSTANLIQDLSANPDFADVQLTTQTFYSLSKSASKPTKTLIVHVHYKEPLDQKSISIGSKKIVKVVFENYPQIDQYDSISITFTNGFNLGLVTFSKYLSLSDTVSHWSQLINANP
jgi:uncharacterized RDD family membrane protein YckC